jgi:uncharacterized protein YyaL (SSP411 family)
VLFAITVARAEAQTDFRAWGLDEVRRIDADLFLPERGLYADAAELGKPAPDKPAFMWGCGVELSALAAAARLDPDYVAPLRRFAYHMEVYWSDAAPTPGYDVLPGPKPPDRYYDDNVWIVLALCDTYEATHDAQYLRRAEQTFQFVLSGKDDKLGGGIYWHEQDKGSKNACVNGPAAAAAVRLYTLTHRRDYLETGRQLYDWTRAHLQDTDGLFFDNIRLDGSVEKMKWSYNTGLMLRASCLLYDATREKRYLDEAERIATAARAHWVDPQTGALKAGGPFAHLLSEAFLALYDADHDATWLDVSRRALTFVHDKVRDANGHYATSWSTPVTAPLTKFSLLDQASVARAYLVLAQEPISNVQTAGQAR